ncbi:MAG: restriction endonuclease subunit S [Tsuneonella suprasediminis]
MIPEGWSEVQVGQLGTKKRPVLKAGPFGSSLTKASYVATGYKVYGQQEVLSGDLGAKDYFISEERFRKLSACAVQPGDILITMMGTVGRVLEVPEGARTGVINPRLMRISVDQGRVLPSFLARRLNTTAIRHLLERRAHGGTMPGLNAKAISTLRFLLPPMWEQRAIVETLKTWDHAIEKVEALIANARTQKQALMQQLLPQGTTPPKKRLSGFSGEWQEVRLGNLVKEVSRDVDWDDEATYKLISVRRRSEGIFHRESLRGHEILTKSMKVALAGDFLISKMQIVHGASALVKANFDGFNISGSYIALVPKDQAKLDIEYFDWYSRTPYFYKLAYINSYGVHIEKMTFNLKSFLKQTIMVPQSNAEQSAIVDRLNSAEALIGVYQSQASALRREKAALMQQLLTGKRRVKLPESEVA